MSVVKTLSAFLFIWTVIPVSMSTVTNVKFEDFQKFTKDPSALVIDVREPNELRETGAIPGSINIPLNQVQNVLKNLNKDEFRKQYRHEKPEESTKVVFTCRSGRRSAQAAQIADKLGYKNVFNFTGGWLEWEEKIRG